jgi:Tfp pilus assembly protein PilV
MQHVVPTQRSERLTALPARESRARAATHMASAHRYRFTASSSRNIPAKTAPVGFTLLEVLLTVILSAMLMAGLWNLFGTYLRLFKTGQSKVAESQLVRALVKKISDDVASAIQAAPHPSSLPHEISSLSANVATASDQAFGFFDAAMTTGPTASPDPFEPNGVSSFRSTTGPAFGLVGTNRTLRLETLQALTAPPKSPAVGLIGDGLDTSPEPRAPEFLTVLYTFEEMREMRPADREPPPGLLRREMAWEAAQSARQHSGPLNESANRLQEADDPAFGGLTPAEVEEAAATGDSLVWVREVVGFQLRYFDGEEWLDEWNSHARGTLPVAVEVSLQIESLSDQSELKRDARDNTPDRQEETTSRRGQSNILSEEESYGEMQQPDYRKVIYLASAKQAASRDLTIPTGSELAFGTPGGLP